MFNATLKIAWTVKVLAINSDLLNTWVATLDRFQLNGAVGMVRRKELNEDEEMPVVSLAPWLPASQRHQRHSVIDAVEHILHRVFPLPDDEPEGRLLAALTRLVDAERLSETMPSRPRWRRLAG